MKKYEENKHIKTVLNHIEEVLEKNVFKALQIHCKKNKREMLLTIKRAVGMKMWEAGNGMKKGDDYCFMQMIYEERRMIQELHPHFISSILQPLIGEHQNRLFNQYCMYSEAIVTMTINNIVRLELGMPVKEESLNV
jgi:hypothetical protein